MWAGGRRGVSTPSEYCQGTYEQGIKPPNAETGPCYELYHPKLYPASPRMLGLALAPPPTRMIDCVSTGDLLHSSQALYQK